MRRELLLLREMRDAALTIRALVEDRSAEQLDGAIATLEDAEDLDRNR